MTATWTASAAFEATTDVESGGAEIVWIPANAILENVLLPPDPNFGDPEAGWRPVEFDCHGRHYTATVVDFMAVGGCRPEPPEADR